MIVATPLTKETLIPSDLIKEFKSPSKSSEIPVPDALSLSLWALIRPPKPVNLSLRLLYFNSSAL